MIGMNNDLDPARGVLGAIAVGVLLWLAIIVAASRIFGVP